MTQAMLAMVPTGRIGEARHIVNRVDALRRRKAIEQQRDSLRIRVLAEDTDELLPDVF